MLPDAHEVALRPVNYGLHEVAPSAPQPLPVGLPSTLSSRSSRRSLGERVVPGDDRGDPRPYFARKSKSRWSPQERP